MPCEMGACASCTSSPMDPVPILDAVIPVPFLDSAEDRSTKPRRTASVPGTLGDDWIKFDSAYQPFHGTGSPTPPPHPQPPCGCVSRRLLRGMWHLLRDVWRSGLFVGAGGHCTSRHAMRPAWKGGCAGASGRWGRREGRGGGRGLAAARAFPVRTLTRALHACSD